MPRIYLKCDDCKNSFSHFYFFIKPDQLKCSVCGSWKVKEDNHQSYGCGCDSNKEKPYRFT